MTEKQTSLWRTISAALTLICLAAVVVLLLKNWKPKEETTAEPYTEFQVLLPDTEISALLVHADEVWVGTTDGIEIYDTTTGEHKESIGGLTMVYASGMCETPDGIIWVGHEGGLTGFASTRERIDFSSPELPKGRINTVCYDGCDLWCGSYAGAARLSLCDGKWSVVETLTAAQGLICDAVNVIRVVGDDLWFASYLDHNSGGLSVVGLSKAADPDRTFQTIGLKEGMPHQYITSLEDRDGLVFAGCGYMTEGGLAVLGDPDQDGTFSVLTTYGKKDGIPGEKVRYLYLDTEDRLWITTEYDGVVVVALSGEELPETMEGLLLTQELGLSDNEIKCMVFDGSFYWLGGKYGLTRIPKAFVDANATAG